MKKYHLLYLLLCGCFIVTSCVRTEEDLFDEPAAVRLNQAVKDAKEMLVSAENGWIMEYFPTNDSRGVIFPIRFNGDGMAVVAAKNEYTTEYAESKGAWNIIDDTGPVLTFDTYIDVLHLFSDPNTKLGNGLGIGLGGDYEFIIISASDTTFALKGKKRGTDIRLHRLPEGQTGHDYFRLQDEMSANLFGKGALPLMLSAAADSLFALSGGSSGIFDAVPFGSDAGENKEKLPFVVTNYGIRLAKPFQAGNVAVQVFNLSDDKNYLYAAENKDIRITSAISPLAFFLDENNRDLEWTLDASTLNGAFQTAYAKVVDGCKTVYKENFGDFFFKYKSDRKSKTFSFRTGVNKMGKPYEGAFDFEILQNPEKAGEVIFVDKGTADTNASVYKSKIEGFGEISDLITGGSYTVATDRTLSMSVLRFTSVSNSGNGFSLSLK
ncbi:MAG: DUF4302 domain-containing protein [Dysgonamonadaceae bacterium]|jgi:hypothetical protein|nr:DUF4302 domain-containing protein [Dysgonamonadaceae bacterium]